MSRDAASVTRPAPFGTTVAVLCGTGLLVVGQLYLVIPLLPAMARDWGVAPGTAAWSTASFGLAYAAGFLVTGPLSDRYGRRPVILGGLAVLAVATLLVAAAPTLPVAVALRVVQGLGAAGFSPAALAYLGERIEPRSRPAALTWLVTAFFASAVVAQVAAQSLGAVVGWRGVFVIGALAVAVAAALSAWVLLPDVPGGASGLDEAFRALGRLARDRAMVPILVAAVPVLGGFAAVYTGLQLHGPPSLIGDPDAFLLVRASGLIAMLAVVGAAGWLARTRAVPRAAWALALAAGACAALAVTGSAPQAVAGVLLVFVGAVTVVSPGLTERVGVIAAPTRGAGVSLYTFALMVGASLGPPLAALGPGLGPVLLTVAGAQLLGATVLAVSAGR